MYLHEYISYIQGKTNYNKTSIKIIFVNEPDSNITDFFNPLNVRDTRSNIQIYNIQKTIVDYDNDFEIDFYKYENEELSTKNTASVYDLPALMGALFSENINDYNCNLRKGFFKSRP